MWNSSPQYLSLTFSVEYNEVRTTMPDAQRVTNEARVPASVGHCHVRDNQLLGARVVHVICLQ